MSPTVGSDTIVQGDGEVTGIALCVVASSVYRLASRSLGG